MAECWPYIPLNEIDEGLSWLTEVDQRRDDESRWGYRAARQTFDLKFRMSGALYLAAEQLLASNISGDWLLPVWTDGTATAITSGDDEIALSTDAEFFAGGKAIIWETWESFEIVDVVEVGSGLIGIYPAAVSSRARCYVMPLRAALIREGATVARLSRETWEIGIKFEAQDNPDLTLLLAKLEVELAIGVSSSMSSTSSTPGFSRLDVAKVNAIAILDHLQRSGVAHDLQVSLYSSSQTSLKREACDAEGYQDLRDFINAATTSSGADYSQALSDSGTFFNDAGRRLTFLISDEAGTGAAAAKAIRDGIARLELFSIMLDDASTATLELLDNTGGARSIDDGNDALFSAVILGILDLKQFGGDPFVPCAGAILGGQSGNISRATAYIDSGLGPVTPVPDRTVVEITRSATIQNDTRAETWQLKRRLHFIQGRNRPFYLADMTVPAFDMTNESATVAQGLLASPEDWTGRVIGILDSLREITSGEVEGDAVIVSFGSVDDLPYPLAIKLLRRVRLYSDDLSIRHNRAAGWAIIQIEAGKV